MDIWNFWDISWGPDEAKGDLHLKNYFVPIPEYGDIKEGKYRYIIGRKGCGKTAICEKLRIDADDNPMAFSSSLSLRNFPLNFVRDLRDKSFRDKSQFVPVWSFLVLIELSKLVLQDNGCRPSEVTEELEHFLVSNSFANEIGFVETIQSLKKNQAKVKISPGWISAEASNEKSTSATIPIHFHAVTNTLLEKLSRVSSNSTFYLFMDELDEGFRAGDSSLRLILLALLRAVEDISIHFLHKNLRVLPIVAMRSDIFDRLEDNDLNKLDDYTVRIRWRSMDVPVYYLKAIPNARIVASLPRVSGIDPWLSVVEDNDAKLPRKVKSSWAYIANSTFERPRDIVKFLKMCRKQKSSGRLNFSIIDKAEFSYSNWFYNELRDEIHSHLPIWKESLACITRIGKGYISANTFLTVLKEDKKIAKWLKANQKEPEDVVETLFEFGVIGNHDGKRWLFKYKDDDLVWNPSMKIIVHFGFRRKLRLTTW